MTMTEPASEVKAPERGKGQISGNGDAPAAAVEDLAPADAAVRWAEAYAERLRKSVSDKLAARAPAGDGLLPPAPSNGASARANGVQGIGGPIVGQYVAFDLAITSPIQFSGLPPYQPSKVIAAGEDAFIVALLFVNPTVDVASGFAVPPTTQLAGREYRMRLEQINLTAVTNVPGQTISGVFSSPAPTLTVEVFQLDTPDPGPDAALIEACATVDIVDLAQPYAAFATNFLDIEDDPGFLFVPPTTGGFRNQIPNRYLVYSE